MLITMNDENKDFLIFGYFYEYSWKSGKTDFLELYHIYKKIYSEFEPIQNMIWNI